MSRKINFNKLKNDSTYKADYNWRMLPNNLYVLLDSLLNRNATEDLLVSVLSLVIPESGGSTANHKNGSMGIISRRGVRKVNYPTSLSGQIHTEMKGLFGPFNKNEWHHGGKGSGYNSAKDALKAFLNSTNLRNTTNSIMRGYVRPEPSEFNKRFNFTNFLKTFLE